MRIVVFWGPYWGPPIWETTKIFWYPNLQPFSGNPAAFGFRFQKLSSNWGSDLTGGLGCRNLVCWFGQLSQTLFVGVESGA